MFWKWMKKKNETKAEELIVNNQEEGVAPEDNESADAAEMAQAEDALPGSDDAEYGVSDYLIEEAIVEEAERLREEEAGPQMEAEVFEEGGKVDREAGAPEEQSGEAETLGGRLVEEAAVEEALIEEMPEEKPEKKGFFKSLFSGLDKTRKKIGDQIDNLINNYSKIDDDLYDELEEILISADVGMNSTLAIIEKLKEELVNRKVKDPAGVKLVLRDVMADFLVLDEGKFDLESPTVLLVIGVNGAGETTTIGKLASRLKKQGRTVTVAAADTFRAAAIDQLKVWAERAGCGFIAQSEGSDPSAVIFDALQSAKSRKTDVLICDTAGRLHNKVNLMNELNKMFRVIEREYPEARREVLLVLDATTGQNAINQAKQFSEAAGITALAVTKMDGTAKGGFVFSIASELGIPVRLIGVGEKIEDLQSFDALSFANAILNME